MINVAKLCKLELLQGLLIDGWTSGADPNSEVKATTKKRKFVDGALDRTHSYLAALSMADDIFKKPGDVKKIWQRGPNNYYLCLTKLDDLSCMHATTKAWTDKQFGNLLHGHHIVIEEPEAIEDSGLGACAADGRGLIGVPCERAGDGVDVVGGKGVPSHLGHAYGV